MAVDPRGLVPGSVVRVTKGTSKRAHAVREARAHLVITACGLRVRPHDLEYGPGRLPCCTSCARAINPAEFEEDPHG
jgi:hypothetical protein